MPKVFFGRRKVNENGENAYRPQKSYLRLFAKGLIGCIVLLSTAYLSLAAMPYIPGIAAKFHPTQNSSNTNGSVLAAATQGAVNLLSDVTFNIPAIFNDTAEFKKDITVDGAALFNQDVKINNKNLDLGTGIVTAANLNNLVHGINAGDGISVTTGTNGNPTVANTGVLSIGGQTGTVTLTAGSGISISGSTITNSAQGGNAFGKITDGTNSFSAGSTNDTLTFSAGSGLSLTTDTSSKKLTFSQNVLTGLTTNGVVYANSATTVTSLTPGTSGYVLESSGTGAAPAWVAASSVATGFGSITTGTNTIAAMTVGSGASLNFTGTGTINASTLLGSTWVSPGAIGSTTANTGAFTTLTGTTVNGLTLTANADGFSAAGGTTSRTLTVTGSNITLTGGGNTLTLTGNASLNQSLLTSSSPSFAGLTVSGFSANGGVVYANGSGVFAQTGTSSSSQCLIGGTTPTWATCASGSSGTNLWQLNSNVLAPYNTTLDLAVGGSATGSAFQVFGLANGTIPAGTASTSGQLTFTASSSQINLLNNNTLSINSSVGGDAGLSGNTDLYISNGGLGFGTSTTVAGSPIVFGNNSAPAATDSYAFGAKNKEFNGLFSRYAALNKGLAVGSTGNGPTNIQTFGTNFGNGTTPVATISGSTTFATLLVDNTTGDLFTASSSGQPRFVITQNGNVGIGTTNPSSGLLQVAGNIVSDSAGNNNIGIQSDRWNNVYSQNFNANGGFITNGNNNPLSNVGLYIEKDAKGNAVSVFNQQGLGPILTASASGVSKFTIGNNGSITDANYTTGGGVFFADSTGLFTQTSAGSSSQCLIGGTTPTWATCASGSSGINLWQLNSKVLSPYNTSLDLAVGGSATGSAFQVFGLANGTIPAGTASTSGYLSFSGSGTAHKMDLLDNGTLGIYNSVGGNAGEGANPALFIANSGNVGVGTTTPSQALDVLTANDTRLYLEASANSGTSEIDFTSRNGSGTAKNSSITNSNNGNLNFNTNGFSNSTRMQIAANGNVGIGTSSPNNTLDIRANGGNFGTVAIASISGATSFAALTVDNSGVGDLFTASSSGQNRFVITQNGNVGVGTALPDAPFDVKVTGGADAIHLHSGSSTVMKVDGNGNISAYRFLYYANGNWYVNIADSQTSLPGILAVNHSGATTSNALGTLDVQANSYAIPVASISGATGKATLVLDQSAGVNGGDIFAASSSGLNRFVIQQGGNVGIGTTTPGNLLQVAGTVGLQNSNTLTGVASYTQFNNGISVGGATTYNITSAGVANLFSGSNITNNGASYFQVGSTAGAGSFVRLYADAYNIGDFALTDGSANTFLYDYVTGNAASLIPAGAMGIGKNVQSPHAVLDVEGGNNSGNAVLILNQTGASNDLLSASLSGTTKFTIQSSGAIKDANYTTAGGVFFADNTGLFTQTSAGSASQCLIGGTTPTWATCASGSSGINLWQLNSNVLSPYNTSLDLAVGGSATGSAFQVFGLANGTIPAGTASTSGQLTFTASSNQINFLNNSTFSINTSVGGDAVTTTPFSIGANATTMTFGTSKTTNYTFNAGNNSIFNYNGTNMQLGNGSAAIIQTTSNAGLSIYSSGTGNLTLGQNSVTGNVVVQPNAGGASALVVNKQGNNDIFTASASGNTRFVIDNRGDVGIGNFAGISALADLDVRANIYTTPVASISGATGMATLVLDQSSGNGDIFAASSSGQNRFVITQNGNVGIGTTTPGQKLVVNAGTIPGTVGAINSSTTFNNTAANTYIDNELDTTVNLTGNEAGAANRTGLKVNMTTHSDANTYNSSSQLRALQLSVSYSGSTTYPNIKSIFLDPENTGTGTTTNMYGILDLPKNTSSGTIGSLYGYYMQNPTNSGTISNAYGFYTELMSTPAQANTYGFYDAGNKDFFGGNVGIGAGSTSPLSTLDVRTNSYTSPVASISGATGMATLQIDQSGVGDLISASNSGATKFVVTRLGNIGINQAIPTARLDIADNISSTLLLEGTANSSDSEFHFLTLSNSGAAKKSGIQEDSNGRFNFYTGAYASGTPFMSAASSGNVAIGALISTTQANQLATLDIHANTYTVPVASVSGSTGMATLILDQSSGNGDIFAASSSGQNRFVITQNGGVGIGTTKTPELLNVNGNILINAQSNASSSAYTSINTAGTFGADSSVLAATSSAVFKGKLFVATKKLGAAGVYRYDGGSTWTLVTHAAGQAVAGDTAGSISGYSMTVFNGQLFIGSQTTFGTGKAAVYSSVNADTTTDNFAITSLSQGTVATAGTSAIDSIDSMAVYGGNLYVLTGKIDGSEVYRYNGGAGGSAFTAINGTPGQLAATGDQVSGGVLAVFDDSLIVGSKTGVGAVSGIYAWKDNSGNATPFQAINSTRGRFQSTTGMQDITAMTVYNGSLYFAATKGSGTVEVYRLNELVNFVANLTIATKLNPTAGQIDPTIDSAGAVETVDSMIPYNGKLYLGTETALGGTGGVYYFDPTTTNNFAATIPSQTKGTFASDTGISAVDTLIEFNGTLYIGTDQSSKAGVYTYSATNNNSFALKFDSGFTNSNYGAISFVGSTETASGLGHTGSFVFSNAISLASAGFDYAEDYPTNDSSLTPGDILAIDKNNPGFVKKATQGSNLVGIYSENPGFRLSQSAAQTNGNNYIPVALNGRVPVKVSLENGPVVAGDFLTASSIPGVAMKATKPGFVVAKALESYDNTDKQSIGKVMAFVNISWADPTLLVTDSGDLNIPANPSNTTPLASTVDALETAIASGSATNKTQVVSGSTQLPNANSSDLSLQISDLQTSTASIEAQLTKLSQIDDLTKRVSLLEKAIPLLATSASGSSSLDTGQDATISGNLSVLGKALFSDVGITGQLSMGLLKISGMDGKGASINTLSGPLEIQSTALETVDIMNGKITIDTSGNIKADSEITAKKYNIDTTDVAGAAVGEATIKAGSTIVVVNTTAVTGDSKIFLTPHTPSTLGIINQVKATSFTVEMDKIETKDVQFDWFIVN